MRTVRVTRALTSAGLIDTRHYAPGSADRGTLIHEATVLWDRGTLASTDPRIEGYLDAYIAWRLQFHAQYVMSEGRLHDLVLKFNGQPDRVAIDEAARRVKIVDFKSGGREPWHGIQLAAYERLVRLHAQQNKMRWADWPMDRLVVYLRADGTFDMQHETGADDWPVFLACLTIHRYRMRTTHGTETDRTDAPEDVRVLARRRLRHRATVRRGPDDVREGVREPAGTGEGAEADLGVVRGADESPTRRVEDADDSAQRDALAD